MSDRREFLKQASALAFSPSCTKARQLSIESTERVQDGSNGDTKAIVLENADMRLAISPNGTSHSLVHKGTGQECLESSARVPIFTITQYRPYDNELQLSYPAKPIAFPAERIRRDGDQLVVEFALVGYEATIGLRFTDAYIGFTLDKLTYKGYTSLRPKKATPIDESVFFQLPVRRRTHFGDWLNVMWDEDVAVNVLATDPYARIDSIPLGPYYVLRAGTVDEIKMEGVGAALITTATDRLLDRIAKVEEDYALPRGVESRRSKEYNQSYYELLTATPETIDRHIQFARAGGFRTMDVYYRSFSQTSGHFPWRPEYPNGIEDVKRLVGKVAAAGIVPGIHIHYNKTDKADKYVTPIPDTRLNMRATFTLREPLDEFSTNITVEENPRRCTLDDGRRILKIQGELIVYERYTTSPPYQFTGCKRGELGTKASSYQVGSGIGLLDVDTWPLFVRFTQNTDIQEEVAQRLGRLYSEAGFKFVYFDGAEDVAGPEYWHTVSRAQWIVHKELKPSPLFAEGACKSHFSWHILTRGNAFDVFRPEVFKAAIRAYPAAEAPQVARDFTSINFGWIGYWAPGGATIGTQPDMIEYATSRAAGWNCPISLVGDLEQFEAHPRTQDNLEVLRRWEDVRATGWLTPGQKKLLQDLDQEHTLLINEQGKFELVPYQQIERAGGQEQPMRAFVFERGSKTYVVYWHMSGNAWVNLPVESDTVRLMADFGKPLSIAPTREGIRLPLGSRMYLECHGISRAAAIAAFQNARVIG